MTTWFRIDNRLVHGQVVEGWLPYLNARVLVVVNDNLAIDELQQQIMSLAIPERIRVRFIPLSQAKTVHDELEAKGRAALFLFANCQDVRRLIEQGVRINLLNIGNMHYGRGKKQVCSHVALSEDDQSCLETMRKQGVRLDFRCVPGDNPVVEDW